MAASRRVILRAGSGSRALPGARPGRSAANVTSRSGVLAIARRHDVTARLNGSVGASLDPVRNLIFDVVIVASPRVVPAKAGTKLTHRHVHRRLREFGVEAALIEFGDQRPFQLVTLVEEGNGERKAELGENIGILSPG